MEPEACAGEGRGAVVGPARRGGRVGATGLIVGRGEPGTHDGDRSRLLVRIRGEEVRGRTGGRPAIRVGK